MKYNCKNRRKSTHIMATSIMKETSKVVRTTLEMAERYRTIIDWRRWLMIVHCLGEQCNGRKDRFDKADILEQAVDICSDGQLAWVDEIGRDHRDIELGQDIEFKFSSYSMFRKTQKICKNSTFKIKNSLGKTITADIVNPADFYMFAQENAIGIMSYAEMLPYLSVSPDGIIAKIPHDKITYIVTPESAGTIEVDEIENACLKYKERKRQMQREFIMSILQLS